MAGATGMALSVAQTLLAALQSKELREVCSIFGYESQLQKLRLTVNTIKSILLDAESKHQELTHEGQDWVEKLKDAVYNVDDLLDEYTTVAQQLKSFPGGKISKKVRRFFSGDNQLLFALNTSREIKKLRGKLDDIAKDRSQFGLSDVYRPVKRRAESCSYVYEQSIIGREADKEAIVSMLVSDFNQQNVSFITVVGIGGLGKTTLAQLVYNDDRIKEAFGDWMNWVCVSEEFGLKEILGKLLFKKELKFEELQREVRNQIEGKRYLLVLDDVWSENRNKWIELRDFLSLGGRGSRILVTSRSMEVANVIGSHDSIYELQGLSDEKSWELFKRIAFKQGKDQEDVDLVKTGKRITKKCANVPLSIRVIGSLLYGQDRKKWLSFEGINLTNMRMKQGENDIMSALMFSYYHLTPKLKSCFSFCSLFPKDYVMKKDVLISLWSAQGYLVPSLEGQIMEEIGEDYFSILLQRCFFQDIKQDKDGNVYSCKMHDLIHDLSQEVAGKESVILTTGISHLGRKIRHLSTTCLEFPDNWFSLSYPSSASLRTFLQPYSLQKMSGNVAAMISHCRRLRVLDLHGSTIGTLPKTVAKLLHLRYLDLSGNKILKVLPKSISKLYNLQILNLRSCDNLIELPKDTSKLVNLRMLDIHGCDKLTHIPAGFHNLKCLHTLSVFIVGGDDSRQVKKGELIDLKALVNLRGELCIKVGKCSSSSTPITTEGVFILRDAHLEVLKIMCELPYSLYGEQVQFDDQGHYHETLLEGLYPNGDLSRIVMSGYQGGKLPSWASSMTASLPGLVSIELSECFGVQHLTSLSQLCHLKYLKLANMPSVLHIENYAPMELMTFFPSLEELELQDIPKLKGWWGDLTWMEMKSGAGSGCLVTENGSMEQSVILPSFPCLRELRIICCKSMAYFPPCPHLKQLDLRGVKEALIFCMEGGFCQSPVTCINSAFGSVSLSCNPRDPSLFCLVELSIDNAVVFNSLFKVFDLGAVRIEINLFDQVKSLYVVREGLQRCVSSLRLLSIYNCQNLKSLAGGGMEYLTNLESLSINECPDLNLEEVKAEEEEGMPWKYLHSLFSLTLINLPKLVSLPKGFQHLTSLQFLYIERCDNLEALGECISFLRSLQSLRIVDCCNLKSLPECLYSQPSLRLLHISHCPQLHLNQ